MVELVMLKLVFTDEEKDKLFIEYREALNPRVRNKLLAVYLKSLETEHSKICEICRVSWPTMLSYFKEYQKDGVEGLTRIKHKGRPSEMNSHADVIKAAFVERPPATIKEARSRIEEITGLTRSIPQVWSFLNRIGFRLRKVGGVPGKANIAEQDAFKKNNLNQDSRKQRKERGKCTL